MRRERDAPEITDEERARATRAIATRVAAGGIVFLLVVALGVLPRALAPWPAAGRVVAVAAWIVAPLLGLGLIVVAALKLRR